jgi:hypothetical protein
MERRRDGQRWCPFKARSVPGGLASITPLQDHLRHFFDEERHPIGGGHNLLPHGGRHLVFSQHQANHLLHQLRPEPIECHVRDMGPHHPRRPHRGPAREYGEERCCGALIDEQLQEFEARWIDPVQIFHNEEHGVLGGQPQDKSEQRFKGLLAPMLGCQGQRRIVVLRQGQRQQVSQERHRLLYGQLHLFRGTGYLREFCRYGLVRLPLEEAWEQLDQRPKSGMLVIR